MFIVDELLKLPAMFLSTTKFLGLNFFANPSVFFSFTMILPAYLLFLLMILPLPKFMQFLNPANLIIRISGYRFSSYGILSKMSVNQLIATIFTVLWALEVMQYYNAFQSGVSCADLPSEAEKQNCRGARWKIERDMYKNLLGCILYWSLHSIAPLLAPKPKQD